MKNEKWNKAIFIVTILIALIVVTTLVLLLIKYSDVEETEYITKPQTKTAYIDQTIESESCEETESHDITNDANHYSRIEKLFDIIVEETQQ